MGLFVVVVVFLFCGFLVGDDEDDEDFLWFMSRVDDSIFCFVKEICKRCDELALVLASILNI